MRERWKNDRGQTIFLAPIGFIIVLLLGGVVLEVGNLHLRQRQLDDLADSAASNAAGAGFDIEHFRLNNQIRVNPGAATNVVNITIDSANSNLENVGLVRVQAAAGASIEVELSYTHQFIFGRQVFGTSQTLNAVGTAALVASGP